jgi:hypothetical protein
MKRTLLQYDHDIEHLLPVDNRSSCKAGIKSLHTSAVASVINNYDNNRVLQCKPPQLSAEESLLSRNIQTKLAQLRSGFSWKLNYYRNRIDPEIPDTCPLCSNSPHDVHHLFNCPANPTNLTPLDLWKKPREAAHFLQLEAD